MPRLPLIFGMTLAWCCGREAKSTAIPEGDGGRAETASTGGAPAGAGSGSESMAGIGPEPSGGSASGGAPTAGAGTSAAVGTGGSASVSAGAPGAVGGGGGVGDVNGGGGVGGVGGVGGDAGNGAAGAPGPSVVSTLCVLAGDDPASASSQLGSLYRSALFNNCRYAALSCGVAIEDKLWLANALSQLGTALWHCDGRAATVFGLVYPGRTVTALDAQALIDLYVTLTLERLPFTPADGAQIRAELSALATASVDENATAISLCNSAGTWNGCMSTGQGGAGVSSGGSTGGGTGGTSGTASSGGG